MKLIPGSGFYMIQWENKGNKIAIKSWRIDRDENTIRQAENLANHPVIRERVCLMPDAHVGNYPLKIAKGLWAMSYMTGFIISKESFGERIRMKKDFMI
jgi:RNA-splicing ligase RtcB